MLSKCSFGNEDLYHDEFKHLNHMEDQILESMAWRYQSPLFEYMKSCDQPIPSCEEVLLPSQLQLPTPSATPTPVIAQSSDPVRNIPQPIHINQHQSINIYPIPYSPSTYVTNKRAESSLAACNFSCYSYHQFSELITCFYVFSSSSITRVVGGIDEWTHSSPIVETEALFYWVWIYFAEPFHSSGCSCQRNKVPSGILNFKINFIQQNSQTGTDW